MNPNESSLTGSIIGAGIRVHRELGPGFLESVYEAALCLELAGNGIAFQRQVLVPILYHGRKVGEHRLDLFVKKQIVVELKAVHTLESIHFAILRSYLKATNCELGLLLNFAANTLDVRRVGREWHARSP